MYAHRRMTRNGPGSWPCPGNQVASWRGQRQATEGGAGSDACSPALFRRSGREAPGRTNMAGTPEVRTLQHHCSPTKRRGNDIIRSTETSMSMTIDAATPHVRRRPVDTLRTLSPSPQIAPSSSVGTPSAPFYLSPHLPPLQHHRPYGYYYHSQAYWREGMVVVGSKCSYMLTGSYLSRCLS